MNEQKMKRLKASSRLSATEDITTFELLVANDVEPQ
jgi:hypothetical protein